MTLDRRAALAAAGLAALLAAAPALAQAPGAPVRANNVVLVHGAFADGSSWAGVVAALQSMGMRAVAVQNPLTSLADDVAATKRALAMMDGPTVLVGHSYGGTVITQAGDDPKVSALVFVAALALEPGELFTDLVPKFPASPGLGQIKAAGGFAMMDEAGFLANFAQDLPPAQARVMAASQGPVAATLFGDKTTVAAWRTKPSYYSLATKDLMIAPELQRFMATRAKATISEVDASHASPVSRAADIARVIAAAAGR